MYSKIEDNYDDYYTKSSYKPNKIKVPSVEKFKKNQKGVFEGYFEFFKKDDINEIPDDYFLNYNSYLEKGSAEMTDLRIKVTNMLIIESSSEDLRKEYAKEDFQKALFADFESKVNSIIYYF